jgi:hypothetical protein
MLYHTVHPRRMLLTVLLSTWCRPQDNWTSITDAQQAAATRALFDLLQPSPDADKQAVLEQLGAPWRGLWEAWAEGAGGAGWEAANQEQEQQRRDAFIR